ncbi:MAG: acetyl-CoA carboxylase biotin carboxylase subunit [Verrucomicrobia bacterium]|nr:acetyl-CoA carboxylase biotin carboxylase subunit [Verrucomicrobiota bacterium]MCH8511015.1 acetyl-CoA carboxylase biotin carboxylase subunit [Kiritimatiellia bacterium]
MQRVLIANRGEIALRIIRACRELGIHTVAVYSQADRDATHVQLADDAICIGPAAASDSYLKISNIISAAEVTDVDAIHPGYGFLAENADFAEICAKCNLKFIGPSPEAIRKMGDKNTARETMKAGGVPITPGSDGLVANEQDALRISREIGYPVIIKATAGGGGKGMRVAHNDMTLVNAFTTARHEAERAFGNAGVYIEKYVESARHIEVQIMADEHGNVVHLGERDCSMQRRNQKVLEEAPSPALEPEVRAKLGAAAIKAAKAVNYANAGTVEFLYDELAGEFYFMEMNTRIQVEHPVTEEVTGIDLIKEQIRVAMGEKLSFTQDDIKMRGHAIEFRVNAEDPARNFAPSPGKIHWVNFPGGFGVRIDSAVYPGYVIPPYYDSMVAKLIVRGRNREEALARLDRALSEFFIDGPKTTIPLGLALLKDGQFLSGKYNTGYLEKFMKTYRPEEDD